MRSWGVATDAVARLLARDAAALLLVANVVARLRANVADRLPANVPSAGARPRVTDETHAARENQDRQEHTAHDNHHPDRV